MATSPSDPTMVQLWNQAQAQSSAFATSTNAVKTAYDTARLHVVPDGHGGFQNVPVYAVGEGSVAASSFTSNGLPPNIGNT